ncbi:MAG: mechanosensitive ion channel family protein [Bacteroidota bacterium]|nr:mechanosensitive ion channel family protein [Bacteroidota bacterium]
MQVAPANIQPQDTTQVADTTLSASESVQVVSSPDTTNFTQDLVDAGLLIAEGQFSEAWSKMTLDLAIAFGNLWPKIVAAFVVLAILYAGYRGLYSLLRRLLRKSNVIQPGLQSLLMQGFRLLSLILIGITFLQTLGINLAALIAGIGVAGIAFGFAARDTVENILSGVNILTDKAFRIGDTLIVNDIYCVVERITLRTTRLRTPKNEVLVVPNQQMANERILNHTIAGALRIEIPFSIAYKEHPQQARKVVLALTEDDPRIMEDPTPSVVVTTMNDSSVDLALWVYVANPKEERQIIYYYTEAIREGLRQANIEIPFPHLQIIQD